LLIEGIVAAICDSKRPADDTHLVGNPLCDFNEGPRVSVRMTPDEKRLGQALGKQVNGHDQDQLSSLRL
jgi:hypothetical protein